MKKTYQEPNAELIQLIPQEEITNGVLDGDMGVEVVPSVLPWNLGNGYSIGK